MLTFIAAVAGPRADVLPQPESKQIVMQNAVAFKAKQKHS